MLEPLPDENNPEGRRDRSPLPTRHAREATLRILNAVPQRRMLSKCRTKQGAVHRDLRKGCKQKVPCDSLTALANELVYRGDIDERERLIARFTSTKGAGDATGTRRRSKAAKVPTITDHHGLRPSVSTHAVDHPEVILPQVSLDFQLTDAKSEKQPGDQAHESNMLDQSPTEWCPWCPRLNPPMIGRSTGSTIGRAYRSHPGIVAVNEGGNLFALLAQRRRYRVPAAHPQRHASRRRCGLAHAFRTRTPK